jgi:hypothetical protein
MIFSAIGDLRPIIDATFDPCEFRGTITLKLIGMGVGKKVQCVSFVHYAVNDDKYRAVGILSNAQIWRQEKKLHTVRRANPYSCENYISQTLRK